MKPHIQHPNRRQIIKAVEAEAKCVGCGKREWFGANDPRIEPGLVPFCAICYNPMVSTGRVRGSR